MSLLYNSAPDMLHSLRFQVYIGPFKMGFSKITGFEFVAETEVVQQGGVNSYSYSLQAPTTVEKTMVFERGLAMSRGLLQFPLIAGTRINMDITIILCNANGTPMEMFFVTGGYVKKCSVSAFDAMSDQIIIESFEISYEGLARVPIPAL